MNRKNKVGAAFTDDGLAMGKTKRLYKSFYNIYLHKYRAQFLIEKVS
jgi:hypothetical protein